jgi:hypothetical protein
MLTLANKRQIINKYGSHYIETSNLETNIEIPDLSRRAGTSDWGASYSGVADTL